MGGVFGISYCHLLCIIGKSHVKTRKLGAVSTERRP
jgi:hypothetical protein